MLTLFFRTRFPPPNSHLKPPGRCPISASHFSKKLPATASGKSHCGNFRTSAPQPPRSANGQHCLLGPIWGLFTVDQPAPWEPARPLQRSLVPSGPEMPKKSRKCLPGPPGPGPQKNFQKVLEHTKKHSPDTFRRLRRFPRLSPRLCGDFLGSQGRRPRETFSRLSRHFGPGGPERPL